MSRRKLAHFSPGRTLLLSIFFTIIAGTFALALPIARTKEIPLLDLFFTATSCTCVTGMFTIPLDDFTMFGKTVLMILIQIGGLGLITMTLFFLSLFANVGLATQLMAGQILEVETWRKIKNIVIFIVLITVFSELIGALSMFPIIKNHYPFHEALFLSFFHAISSFCNAGISLFKDNAIIVENYVMLYTTTLLIFLGGLGFITWYESMKYLVKKIQKKKFRFSLHSKIVLYGSFTLVVLFTIIFWILEHQHLFLNTPIIESISKSLFYVVSYKSTGYEIIPFNHFQLATLFLIMVISFIGSSPGSTGSGIKITTLVVFISTVKAAISGKTSVDIKGRRIPLSQVFRAIAIVAVSACWIGLTTFCLLITEPGWGFLDLLFESSAAFTTIGTLNWVTPTLSTIGKIFIIMSMIVGRIGSYFLILAIRMKPKVETSPIKYPEERVMLG